MHKMCDERFERDGIAEEWEDVKEDNPLRIQRESVFLVQAEGCSIATFLGKSWCAVKWLLINSTSAMAELVEQVVGYDPDPTHPSHSARYGHHLCNCNVSWRMTTQV